MKRVVAGIALVLAAAPASAHFQTIYAPSFIVDSRGDQLVKLIFWHPLLDGPNVDMPLPQQVYVVSRRVATDISDTLTPITFTGPNNAAEAYEVTFDAARIGDHVLVVEGDYFYDATTDVYIQQFAKAIFNFGGFATDWNRSVVGLSEAIDVPFDFGGVETNVSVNQPTSLPTEIVPLNRPYSVWAGSTFTGVLLAEGMPVRNHEIEVIYLPSEPDMATNTAAATDFAVPPGGSMTVMTDANGVFTVGTPFPGFWGFGAIGSGPVTEHEGKFLFQDAVLWIEVHEVPGAP